MLDFSTGTSDFSVDTSSLAGSTRIPVERLDENDRITGVGTARQRGVTLDDYQTNSGTPLQLRYGEKFVRTIIIPPTGAVPDEIELEG